jgi:hypothetical protein
MEKYELLSEVWKKGIYSLALNSTDAANTPILEKLEVLGYVVGMEGREYKISYKGKLRVLYNFLLEKYNEISGEGYGDDYYFEDNESWFNERMSKDDYDELKQKLINMQLIKRGYAASIKIFNRNFEKAYEERYNSLKVLI